MPKWLFAAVLCAAGSLPLAAAGQAPSVEPEARQAIRYYSQGQALFEAERYEEAAREFAAAIRAYPLLTDAHYGLGQTYMNLRRYASATQAFERCLDAARRIHGLRNRARVAAAWKAIEAADAQSRRQDRPLETYMMRLVRNQAPAGAPFEPPAPVLVALGSAHFRSGNRAAAEQHWTEAVAVDRGIGEAWNNLAVIYLTSGRKAAALEAVDNAERAGVRVNPRLKADIGAMTSSSRENR